MKAFLKQIFASFFGSCLSISALAALVFFGLFGLIGFFAGAIDESVKRLDASGGNAAYGSDAGGVLVIDLSRGFSDAPTFSPANTPGFFSDEKGAYGLLDTILALEAAATDEAVDGVLLLGGDRALECGFATIGELRNAILKYRAVGGKPVFAYLPSPTYKEYLLGCAASSLWIHPFAELPINGFPSTGLYFKNALEKLGVGVQVTRVGTHKSAVEPLISDKMSEQDRSQRERILAETWGHAQNFVAALRTLGQSDAERSAFLTELCDASEKLGVVPAKIAVEKKFVDDALYEDEMLAHMRTCAGTSPETNTFRQIALDDYLRARGISQEPPLAVAGVPAAESDEPCVAVVYAEGEIVNGYGASDEVGGKWFSRALREVRENDTVKAVVLRVNSPGGSVFASEQIRRELELTAASKPLVVSMGDVAASGGYWISVPAGKIFADPLTITGSIGVFGLHFNLEKLGEKIGVGSEAVSLTPFAELETIRRPKTPEEMERFQAMTDEIYARFLSLVADAREMSVKDVDAIAQGQVWTGFDALRLGLVDEFGGLADALALAREQAGLGDDAPVVSVPGEVNRFQPLLDLFDDSPVPVAGAGTPFGKSANPVLRSLAENFRRLAARLRAFNDPNGLYARLPLDVPADAAE